ncbi:hypothetical protein K438DRAFT_684434 [Mycena galopus ATCC 62051]|nr:hypothetical protein K438DRAFT_684434 [Mycena galopus ATCC 62051]
MSRIHRKSRVIQNERGSPHASIFHQLGICIDFVTEKFCHVIHPGTRQPIWSKESPKCVERLRVRQPPLSNPPRKHRKLDSRVLGQSCARTIGRCDFLLAVKPLLGLAEIGPCISFELRDGFPDGSKSIHETLPRTCQKFMDRLRIRNGKTRQTNPLRSCHGRALKGEREVKHSGNRKVWRGKEVELKLLRNQEVLGHDFFELWRRCGP